MKAAQETTAKTPKSSQSGTVAQDLLKLRQSQSVRRFFEQQEKKDTPSSAAAMIGQSSRSQSTRIKPTDHQPKNSTLAESFLDMLEARRQGKLDVGDIVQL